MKITRPKPSSSRRAGCFKIETDEASSAGASRSSKAAHTVEAAVQELADYLVGRDPLLIEDHWQVMYRAGFYRGGPITMSAIAGVDAVGHQGQASRRARARAARRPGRDRIKVYSWIGGDRPSDVANNARAVVERGFKAVKMNGSEELQIVDTYDKVEQVIANVAAVRDAVGPHVGIGVDFHGRVHKPMAKVLAKELDPYKLMFIEEPVLSENAEAARHRQPDQHADRARRAALLALGFQAHPRGRHVDIIQPDASHAGGITECRKIATLARATTSRSRCTARCHCARRVPAARRGQLQRIHPGAEPRHPLQQATTCSTTCATPRCSATRTASSRSRRAAGIDVNEEKVREMAKRAPLAQPGVASRGRQRRRVVSAMRGVRLRPARQVSIENGCPRAAVLHAQCGARHVPGARRRPCAPRAPCRQPIAANPGTLNDSTAAATHADHRQRLEMQDVAERVHPRSTRCGAAAPREAVQAAEHERERDEQQFSSNTRPTCCRRAARANRRGRGSH